MPNNSESNGGIRPWRVLLGVSSSTIIFYDSPGHPKNFSTACGFVSNTYNFLIVLWV